METKKRLSVSILCMFTLVFSAIGLAGCATSECSHQWGEWSVTKNATCSQTGEQQRTCAKCGEAETDVVELAAHVPSEDYKDCLTGFTCSVCGETQEKLTRHYYGNDNVCTVCGVNYRSEGLRYTRSDDGTYYSCSGIGSAKDTEIFIASSYKGLPVTSVCEKAFEDCNSITSVTIPDGVTSIGAGAFRLCYSITSVTISDSVTSIGAGAFSNCGLTSINIGNGVTFIGLGAFKSTYCDLTSITVSPGNSVYHSSDNCLIETQSKKLILGCQNSIIPDDGSVISIGIEAFIFSAIKSITIPDSVAFIGDNAFGGCEDLTSVTIGNGVTAIGAGAFGVCDSLTSVIIPDSVTSIGNYAFEYCKRLTSVIIGNGVTSIGFDAFSSCDSLTSVIIGNGVISIGEEAFGSCDSLTGIYYKGILEEWGNITIAENNDNLTSAKIYYYSETEPTESGIFWHFDNDGIMPVVWR